jgi:uracil-DNA glycosylase
LPRPKPRFAHGGRYTVGRDRILTTYHPSQQNTFTGKLTPAMLRAVLRAAVAEAKRLGA